MSKNAKGGRLVLNHSTHIPGLLRVLDRLVDSPGIKTVTPGRLARVKGRPTPLTIRVTIPIMGGHKLQARSKGNVQEVFVITKLDAQSLQSLVNRLQSK